MSGTSIPTLRNAPTFAGIGGHLSDSGARIQQVARRSRRFSWYSWGFLIVSLVSFSLAPIVGSYYPTTVTTTTLTSVSYYTTLPWWVVPLGLAAPLTLVALAVREVALGRRESRAEPVGPSSAIRTTTDEGPPNWTEVVQRSQKMLTHSKSEVEWSFVPIVLGFVGAVGWLFDMADQLLPPTANNAQWVFYGPVVALPLLALLWPLYRAAREWIGAYQSLLDRQVGEISRLEAEFLWRFGGAASTA